MNSTNQCTQYKLKKITKHDSRDTKVAKMFLLSETTILRVFISRKNETLKLQTQNKDDKISHGRGNSLRNKVTGWMELNSPDPVKPLPTG